VLHRDIKPSNLLLDRRTTVWVTDFGLAKADDSEDLTHTGDVLGTLRYMPPEAFEGHSDARGDVFSLGLTLYELLAFRPAFEEKDRNKLIKQVTTGEPPRLDRLNPELPRDLVTIVHKAIDRDPQQRYALAGELAADLRRFADDEPIQARPVGSAERLWRWSKRNPLLAGLTGAVAMLLAAVAVVASVGYVQTKLAHAQTQLALAREAEQRATAEAGEYAGSINLAQQAWQNDNLQRVRSLLEQTAAYPHRGFEWYYLQRLCHLELQTLIGHRAAVSWVAWSPDGKRLATASSDRTAKVWEAASGRELLTIQGHTSEVYFVSWSPDGQRLGTASADGTAKVWEAVSGREVFTLKGHTSCVETVLWSPDGLRLATASDDQTAKLWDAASGRQLLTFKGHWGTVESLSWSPDGKRLATASTDRTAKVWETTSGQKLLSLPHKAWVGSVSWSRDGKRLATGDADGRRKYGRRPAAGNCSPSKGIRMVSACRGRRTASDWRRRVGKGRRRCGRRPVAGSYLP
jgi:hypothetical protein